MCALRAGIFTHLVEPSGVKSVVPFVANRCRSVACVIICLRLQEYFGLIRDVLSNDPLRRSMKQV